MSHCYDFCFCRSSIFDKACVQSSNDHGFVVDNKLINIGYFEALLNISTSELTIPHKLTPHHLCLKGSLRQKKEAAVIVQLCNDWFDLLKSRSKIVANYPSRNAYVTNLDQQTLLLDKMRKYLFNPKNAFEFGRRHCSFGRPSEEEAIVQGTFVEAPYLEDHAVEQDILKLAESYEIKEKIHRDSLKYITGFVACKFKHKYNLGSPTGSYERQSLEALSCTPMRKCGKLHLYWNQRFIRCTEAVYPQNPKFFKNLRRTLFLQLKDS
nr:unnamed protein product [Callosobruchus analis]